VSCTCAKTVSTQSIIFFKGTHYAIARHAIERGLHVLVTKPATQLLSHHLELIDLSRKHNVVCFVEHHKRCVPAFPLSQKPVLFPWRSCTSQVRPCLQRCTSAREGTWRVQFLQRMDEPAKISVGDLPSMGRQRLRHQVTCCVLWVMRHALRVITKMAVIIYHLTISISVAGSCKTGLSQLVLWPVRHRV